MKRGILAILIVILVAATLCGCTQQLKLNQANSGIGNAGAGMGQRQGAGAGNAGNAGSAGAGGRGPHGSMQHGMRGNEMAPGFNMSYLKSQIMSYPKGNLTPVEREDLIHMIQEEKLAHDVYITLYEKWKLPIFQNIARSESTHMAAIEALLQKYNITNPVANMGVGQFANPNFTKLYNELVSEGSKNVTSALKVGALIEDLDIYDLQKCINQTDKPDIKLVYSNLMKGSRNHMRAFVSMLKPYNSSYTPKYISIQEFNQIISTQTERGMTRSTS